jgi:hypothetical protein
MKNFEFCRRHAAALRLEDRCHSPIRPLRRIGRPLSGGIRLSRRKRSVKESEAFQAEQRVRFLSPVRRYVAGPAFGFFTGMRRRRLSERLLRTRDAAELLDANYETVQGWRLKARLPGGRLAAPKREEHLHTRSTTCSRERAAVRQSRDEREPEAALISCVPGLTHSFSAVVCNNHCELVADLPHAHFDGPGFTLRVGVLDRVHNGLADAELDGIDLHTRQTGLAGKARDSVAQGADALRSCIGAYLKQARHRTSRDLVPGVCQVKTFTLGHRVTERLLTTRQASPEPTGSSLSTTRKSPVLPHFALGRR